MGRFQQLRTLRLCSATFLFYRRTNETTMVLLVGRVAKPDLTLMYTYRKKINVQALARTRGETNTTAAQSYEVRANNNEE